MPRSGGWLFATTGLPEKEWKLVIVASPKEGDL
jgi:hypothetical protein